MHDCLSLAGELCDGGQNSYCNKPAALQGPQNFLSKLEIVEITLLTGLQLVLSCSYLLNSLSKRVVFFSSSPSVSPCLDVRLKLWACTIISSNIFCRSSLVASHVRFFFISKKNLSNGGYFWLIDWNLPWMGGREKEAAWRWKQLQDGMREWEVCW